MRRLTSIVAVNPRGVIGCGNALPWKVKSDLRFFKQTTRDNVVIMGRKTFESIGGPLPGRFNIVLTHQFSLFAETELCRLAFSIPEALAIAEAAPKQFKQVFIVGGSLTYSQFASYVDEYLITIIDKEVPDGDAFFDEGLIGDIDQWSFSPMTDGFQKNEGDEAPFHIYKLKARDQRRRGTERAELVMRHQAKQKPAKSRESTRGSSYVAQPASVLLV